MDAPHAILFAGGKDHPGLLDAIAQFLAEHNINAVKTRVSNLHGRFAMLMLVTADPSAMQQLREELMDLADEQDLDIALHDAAAEDSPNSFPFRLTLNGTNEIGVLQGVGNLMRVLNINIDDIETDLSAEGFAGTLNLEVPRDLPLAHLRDLLDQLMKRLKVRSWELHEG